MQTIYRIEHKRSGKGFFLHEDRRYNLWWEMAHLNSTHQHIKVARNEFKEFSNEYFCAYNSLRIMKRLVIQDDFKRLETYGFNLYRLEVSRRIKGKYQSIFMKRYTRKKTLLTIDQIYR